jgi:hypothetical protein
MLSLLSFIRKAKMTLPGFAPAARARATEEPPEASREKAVKGPAPIANPPSH